MWSCVCTLESCEQREACEKVVRVAESFPFPTSWISLICFWFLLQPFSSVTWLDQTKNNRLKLTRDISLKVFCLQFQVGKLYPVEDEGYHRLFFVRTQFYRPMLWISLLNNPRMLLYFEFWELSQNAFLLWVLRIVFCK